MFSQHDESGGCRIKHNPSTKERCNRRRLSSNSAVSFDHSIQSRISLNLDVSRRNAWSLTHQPSKIKAQSDRPNFLPWGIFLGARVAEPPAVESCGKLSICTSLDFVVYGVTRDEFECCGAGKAVGLLYTKLKLRKKTS